MLLEQPLIFVVDVYLGEGFNNDFEQNKIADSGYDHYFIFDKAQEYQAILLDPGQWSGNARKDK